MAADANAGSSRSREDDSRSSQSPSASAQPPSESISAEGSLLHPVQLAGRSLGQYTVLEKIGQGGMGSVFKAFDTALERTVALKVLFSNVLDDPKQAERFMREARSLARLNHPNLLHVYNVGVESDCHYFAMDLLPGGTLSAEIKRRRRIEPRELIDWIGQVLSALHYVHCQGILHRDIKSGNVMIHERRAVLMDFGLAKDDHFSGLTSVGVVLGTPDYISPEAAEGASAGPPTDIYSLGVVMYEALTGSLPFTGRSAMSIIRQHLEDPPPQIETVLPGINPLLASVIHKCLAKKSSDRYADCKLLARDLVRAYPTAELSHLAEAAPLGSATAPPNSHSPRGSLDATIVDPARTGRHAPEEVEATMMLRQGPVVEAENPASDQPVHAAGKGGHSGLFWAAVGFFGMLLLVFFFTLAQRQKRKPDTEWKGQAILRNSPGISGEKLRWLRFDASDSDPAKWYHEIERRQADGSWKRERISHDEYIGKGGATFDILPEDAEGR